MSQALFSAQSIENVRRSSREKVQNELAKISDCDELDDPETAARVRTAGRLDLPELSRSDASFDTQERGQDLDVTVSIPVTSGWSLLSVKPQTVTTVRPTGHVERPSMLVGNSKPILKISDTFPRTASPGEIKAWATKRVDHVQDYIELLRQDVEMHNTDVEKMVEEGLGWRRRELSELGDLRGGLSGGI